MYPKSQTPLIVSDAPLRCKPLYLVFFLKSDSWVILGGCTVRNRSFIDLDKEQLLNALRLEPILDFCVLKVHLRKGWLSLLRNSPWYRKDDGQNEQEQAQKSTYKCILMNIIIFYLQLYASNYRCKLEEKWAVGLPAKSTIKQTYILLSSFYVDESIARRFHAFFGLLQQQVSAQSHNFIFLGKPFGRRTQMTPFSSFYPRWPPRRSTEDRFNINKLVLSQGPSNKTRYFAKAASYLQTSLWVIPSRAARLTRCKFFNFVIRQCNKLGEY